MKRDYLEFQERSVPLAFLITFRCYGTWLHGDDRGSVDRGYAPWIEVEAKHKELAISNLKNGWL